MNLFEGLTSGGSSLSDWLKARRLPDEPESESGSGLLRSLTGGTPRAARPVPFSGDAFDFLLAGSPYLTSRQAPGQNLFRSYQVPGLPVVRWEMYFRDFSGGLDLEQTEISDGPIPNKLAVSELDARYSRTLCLLPLTATDGAAGKLMGNDNILSAVLIQGETASVIAGGDATANQSLFTLGAAVTAQTYSPGSAILSLAGVRIATVVERLLVGRSAAAAQILSGIDGTPATDGTMHANTASCFGAIVSPFNSTTPGASTILLYSNDGIWTLSSTAAIGDAPTQVLSNIPGGGYALGIATLGNSPVRAYWVWPQTDQGDVSSLGTRLNAIYSTNLEGADPQALEIGLPFVLHALRWREGIVATDGFSVIWHNGQKVNLNWSRERDHGDNLIEIQALAVKGPRLFVNVAELVSLLNNVITNSWWEEYIPEENAWYRASTSETANADRRSTALNTGVTAIASGIDVARTTLLYWYGHTDGGVGAPVAKWYSLPLVEGNPFYRQTSGEMSTADFATTGFADTPVYHFFEGFPKVVSDIWFGGRLIGEDSQVRVDIASQSASEMAFSGNQYANFKEDDHWTKHRWSNSSPELLDRLQFRFTITQGTSGTGVTQTTPNALPLLIRGYIFLDGQERYPSEIAR